MIGAGGRLEDAGAETLSELSEELLARRIVGEIVQLIGVGIHIVQLSLIVIAFYIQMPDGA